MAKSLDLGQLLDSVSNKLKGKSNIQTTLDSIGDAVTSAQANIKDGLEEIKDKGLTAKAAKLKLEDLKSKAISFKGDVVKADALATRIKKLLATSEKKLSTITKKTSPAAVQAINNIKKYKSVLSNLDKVTKESEILTESEVVVAETDIDDKSRLSSSTTTNATVHKIDVDVIITEGLNGFSIKTGESKVEVIKKSGRHEDSSVIGSSTLVIEDAAGKHSKVKFDSVDTMGKVLEIYKFKKKLTLFDVDFTRGFVAIVGPSGSGKTTLGKTIIDTYLAQNGVELEGNTNNILLRTMISQVISVSGEDREVKYGDKHVQDVLYSKQPSLKDQQDITSRIAFISMNEPEAGSAQYGLYSFMAAIYHAIANKDVVIIDSFKEIHTVLHGPAVAKGFTWSMSAILSKINNFALKNDCLVYGIFNPVLDDPVIEAVMDQFMKANCQGIISLKRNKSEFKINYYNREDRGSTNHSLTPRAQMEDIKDTKAVPYYKYNRGRK